METVTEISGYLFLFSFFFEGGGGGGETLFPPAERDFLSSENCFFLFRASFLQVKTVAETS